MISNCALFISMFLYYRSLFYCKIMKIGSIILTGFQYLFNILNLYKWFDLFQIFVFQAVWIFSIYHENKSFQNWIQIMHFLLLFHECDLYKMIYRKIIWNHTEILPISLNSTVFKLENNTKPRPNRIKITSAME